MTRRDFSVGIIGTGMLGAALARALWQARAQGSALYLSNRSGHLPDLEGFPADHLLTDPQALADACDVIVLCVPPAAARSIQIQATGKLVISVMAGVPLAEIVRLTQSSRAICAMSSPAAAHALAYSPWFAAPDVTAQDRSRARAIFEACGTTDELETEDHLAHFTALTGPVPGFVAACAAAMADHIRAQGIAPEIADRAIRQLFLGAGQMMAEGPSPATQVQEMIDYDGTTAAGLRRLQSGPFAREIAAALESAVQKTREIY
ncbi:pyrroline-5-carboxylate reductase [Thioclava dalianensis]|uniref:Pyrroline-5-carboxylate reductase n=1 Tax=Thioclava dalianensis TaxID=1185766 RepID=A0A074TPL8_9RHOB|nr:pyrroline-5-carboxylate reductase dimerization domain-containing protein [Thioclava dalianensis]KEP70933.1 pyrroline-5-carboxylate reductase [Thioclava dalianensis]SFN13975.1 pyrroline-5-carboxylate reductase [Thioclava dalianensis]